MGKKEFEYLKKSGFSNFSESWIFWSQTIIPVFYLNLIKRVNFPYKDRKHGVSKWNKNFLSKINLMIKYVFKLFKLMYFNMFKIIKWKKILYLKKS